ncbi:hypothetical protein COLO4_03780 [Corchorus olitorius]|uniref:Uncharacterized protein n=1 Tax=Corchorus olitorius TaxID=93759 RepID=A0A1R3KWM6_9ROSI|nr:hypothetical protein COLO4_03780 [Corchorus olitorius]
MLCSKNKKKGEEVRELRAPRSRWNLDQVAMLEVGGGGTKLKRFVLSGYFRCFPALSSTHVQGAADVDHIIHWKITAWQVISVSNA